MRTWASPSVTLPFGGGILLRLRHLRSCVRCDQICRSASAAGREARASLSSTPPTPGLAFGRGANPASRPFAQGDSMLTTASAAVVRFVCGAARGIRAPGGFATPAQTPDMVRAATNVGGEACMAMPERALAAVMEVRSSMLIAGIRIDAPAARRASCRPHRIGFAPCPTRSIRCCATWWPSSPPTAPMPR